MLTIPTLLWMLVACGSGDWTVTTWGEDYIEQAIPAADFADGCEATFTTFEVEVLEAVLLDGNGDVAGDAGTGRFAMTDGVHTIGTAPVAATFYDAARFRIGPDGGTSVTAAGQLTCGPTTVTFDWSFATETTYVCEPEGLTVPSGGSVGTELTIHGDHFFYDGLANDDAEVRGEAIVAADADADGVVTLAELAAVSVADLGYSVGPHSEVTNFEQFITHLTRTLAHVDGEGHCEVAF